MKSISIKHLPLMLLLLVALGMAVNVLLGRGGDPSPAERGFVEHLQSREWGELYDQAPPGNFAPSLSREQFVQLMGALGKGVADKQLQNIVIEPIPDPRNDPSRGDHGITLYFNNARNREDHVVQHLTTARRTRRGWQIPINWLPTRFAEMQAHSSREYWSIIGAAMKGCQIRSYRSGIGKTEISAERIDEYLAGKRPEKDVYIMG